MLHYTNDCNMQKAKTSTLPVSTEIMKIRFAAMYELLLPACSSQVNSWWSYKLWQWVLFLSWVTVWPNFCCHKWRLKPLQLGGSISVQLYSESSFQQSNSDGVRWTQAYTVISFVRFQPDQVQRWKITQWLSLGVNFHQNVWFRALFTNKEVKEI